MILQGTVLFYAPAQDSGLIRGTDQARYYFAKADCLGGFIPQVGQVVEFVAENNLAREIVALGEPAATTSEPSPAVAPPPSAPTGSGWLIHNIPGVVACVVLLLCLFIPYGDLTRQAPSLDGLNLPMLKFTLAGADLGPGLVALALLLGVAFALGLNWHWALWPYTALIGLSIITLFSNDGLFVKISAIQKSMREVTSFGGLSPTLTVPPPSATDFLTFGFYLFVLTLLALAYLVLAHPYQVRRGPMSLSVPVPRRQAVEFIPMAPVATAPTPVADEATVTPILEAAGLPGNGFSVDSQSFQRAGAALEDTFRQTEQQHSFFFHFIRPLFSTIDSGSFFRQPFYWIYTLFALIALLLPVITLISGVQKDVFDMPFKITLAFLLVLALMSFASWVIFQLWWDRKERLKAVSNDADDFVATPVFSHFIQTMGESFGFWFAIMGSGGTLIILILVGSEARYLTNGLGLDLITGGSFLMVLAFPLIGYFIVIFSRVLAELIRSVVSIANNTGRLGKQ